MTGPEPLPRSLDPLDDESLPGYLLRLSHRLNLPPLYLARRTGLTTSSEHQVARHLMLGLTPAAAAAFSYATRLSTDEITGLTLAPTRLRHRPAAVSAPRGWTPTDQWLFTSASRHCPACLAGNGSPIQDQLGGAWKKSWLLTVVFACPLHQVFLQHQCPACRQPAGVRSLLRPADSSLHPAQCRATPRASGPGKREPACAHRLDDASTRTPASIPGTRLLEFQTRMTDLLRSRGPAEPAACYFTDLRLVTALIRESWPQSRELITDDMAHAVQRHADACEQVSLSQRRSRLLRTGAPPDATACAALLHAADTILTAADLRETLAPLVASLATGTCRVSRSHWARVFVRDSDACSQRLRQAAEPLTRAYGRTGGRSRGTRAPLRSGGFRPEHIAAYLQQDWYDKHFSRLGIPSVKALRRTAAVCLVQLAAGESLAAAAQFLGINPNRTLFTTATAVRDWAKTQADPACFDSALRALADELDATPVLIDYHHRRAALLDWYIDDTDWQELISQLPPTPGPVQPVLNDRKRQEASNFVWVSITQGEHLFAPRPLQALQSAADQEHWARHRSTTWSQLTRSAPKKHYADLKNLLNALARGVTDSIDRPAAQPAQHRPAGPDRGRQPG